MRLRAILIGVFLLYGAILAFGQTVVAPQTSVPDTLMLSNVPCIDGRTGPLETRAIWWTPKYYDVVYLRSLTTTLLNNLDVSSDMQWSVWHGRGTNNPDRPGQWHVVYHDSCDCYTHVRTPPEPYVFQDYLAVYRGDWLVLLGTCAAQEPFTVVHDGVNPPHLGLAAYSVQMQFNLEDPKAWFRRTVFELLQELVP